MHAQAGSGSCLAAAKQALRGGLPATSSGRRLYAGAHDLYKRLFAAASAAAPIWQ